jgi:hypothetical protein
MRNHDAFENMIQSSCLFCHLFDFNKVALYYIHIMRWVYVANNSEYVKYL